MKAQNTRYYIVLIIPSKQREKKNISISNRNQQQNRNLQCKNVMPQRHNLCSPSYMQPLSNKEKTPSSQPAQRQEKKEKKIRKKKKNTTFVYPPR
jgi:hypothetical protein